MTDKEFRERLKENKWFDDAEKLINYRWPVIEYYVHNINMNMIINGVPFSFKNMDIKKPQYDKFDDNSFGLMNQAFDGLVNRINNNKL